MLRLRPRIPEPPAFHALDMTPMIDVTFQLIIFFLLVMDMSSSQLQPLHQPSARNARVWPPDAGEIVVNVSGDGRLRVFGKTLTDEGLEAILDSHRRTLRADFPVLIRADRSAPFERIQKIMAMAQEAGVSRLRFGAKLEVNR